MIERDGFCIQREDGRGLAGYPPTHTHHFGSLTQAIENARELPVVAAVLYVGDDRPIWRERPTCAGEWLNCMGVAWKVDVSDVDDPEMRGRLAMYKPWFGPIPKFPESLPLVRT